MQSTSAIRHSHHSCSPASAHAADNISSTVYPRICHSHARQCLWCYLYSCCSECIMQTEGEGQQEQKLIQQCSSATAENSREGIGCLLNLVLI